MYKGIALENVFLLHDNELMRLLFEKGVVELSEVDDSNVGLCKAVRRSVFCIVCTNRLLIKTKGLSRKLVLSWLT